MAHSGMAPQAVTTSLADPLTGPGDPLASRRVGRIHEVAVDVQTLSTSVSSGAAKVRRASAAPPDAQGGRPASDVGGSGTPALAAAVDALRPSVEAERRAQGLARRIADVRTLVRLAGRVSEAQRQPAESTRSPLRARRRRKQ